MSTGSAETIEGRLPLPSPEGAAPPAEALRTGGRSEAAGIPASILIGTIALLVCLVSLPQFRAHVVDANRKDARTALRVLAPVVFERAWSENLNVSGEAPALIDVVQVTERLAHRFPDARPMEQSDGVLHHGYRIETGFVLSGMYRTPALLAWPNDYGRTGDAAFAIVADGTQYVHGNGGLWSGADRPLVHVDLTDESWRVH